MLKTNLLSCPPVQTAATSTQNAATYSSLLYSQKIRIYFCVRIAIDAQFLTRKNYVHK
jgi:hypothetical protein